MLSQFKNWSITLWKHKVKITLTIKKVRAVLAIKHINQKFVRKTIKNRMQQWCDKSVIKH